MNFERLNLRKNVVYSVASFIVNFVLIFATYRLVIIKGGLEMLGLWSTLYAWTSIIRIGDVGMASATLRFVAMKDSCADPVEVRRYIDTGIISNGVLFLLLSYAGYVLLSGALDIILEPGSVQEALCILPYMFLSFFLFNFSNLLLGSLNGLHLGYLGSQITVIGNLIQIVAVVILIPDWGLVGLAWAQSIQYAISALIAWVLIAKKVNTGVHLPVLFELRVFVEMLGFSIKSQIANVANGLFEPLSKILVSHFGGLQVQGLYELAYKTIWLPRNAIITGVTAMIPAFTALAVDSTKNILPLYRKSVFYSWLPVLLVVVLIACASPIISIIWIGHFEPDYTLFISILGVGAICNAWGASAYNLSVVMGVLKNNIVVNVTVLILLSTLGVLIGDLFGIYFLVCVISVCMAVGGIWIKYANEALAFKASQLD